jgi:glycosyltransferase involved in cell wall biosynthesis
MKVCALIPVYNNARTIGAVVRRCRDVMEPDVLVISDGSEDGSEQLARDAGASVVALPENQGKGAALRAGMQEAADRGYSHVAVVDADGQHLPEELPRLLEVAWDHPDQIVVGVRRMDNGAAPASSRRGRSISNFWATLNGWQRCLDTQSGFRIYPVEPILGLGCSEPGFAFEMEVLVRASWSGVGLQHVEVDVVYPPDEADRVTHFDMRSDNLRFTWLSFKLFWGMMARSPLLLWRKLGSV